MHSELSVWGMFLAADIVVQTVMAGLIFASLIVWALLFLKSWEIDSAKKTAQASINAIKNAGGVSYAPDTLPSPAVSALVADARTELNFGGDEKSAIKERIATALERSAAAEARRIAKHIGILATIGSTAPFVGLFGTVWGIMNSFIGIAESRTTNLAVVAPGIAEALLATACGLIVAIPAVVIYNMFTRSIGAYRALILDAAASVQILAARELDGVRANRVAAQ